MENWSKIVIALILVGLIFGVYCKQGKEQLMMPQPSVMPVVPVMAPLATTTDAGGLTPADTDPMDYAPYKKDIPTCAMQQPFAA